MNQHVFSLYRTYLRQVRALPHAHLRHFFRIKGADDFRSVLRTTSVQLRKKKLQRVSKDLQRLRAANGRRSTAFDRMLDISYGRVGKLRRELIEPLLSSSSNPLHPGSPTYSPELSALLISGVSRTTRALQKRHLVSPPGLPGRAKPNSEDKMLSGPLSKRREYNIQWRFFKGESRKVYPPLQLSPERPEDRSSTHTFSNHPVNSDFENVAVLRELLVLAGPPSSLPDPPNKQRKLQTKKETSGANPSDKGLPCRWLRRRYQALLGRIPLLIPRPSPQDRSDRSYDVQLADNAITPSRSPSPRLRVVDVEDIPWMSDVYFTAESKRRRR